MLSLLGLPGEAGLVLGEEVGLGGEQVVLAAMLRRGALGAGQAADLSRVVQENGLAGDAVYDGPMVMHAVQAEDDRPIRAALLKVDHGLPEFVQLGGGLA